MWASAHEIRINTNRMSKRTYKQHLERIHLVSTTNAVESSREENHKHHLSSVVGIRVGVGYTKVKKNVP